MSALTASWTTPQLGFVDPQIAAGRDVVVVSTNQIVGFYDRKGALLPPKKPIPGKRPPPPWVNPIAVSALFAPLTASLTANLNLPAGVDPTVFGFNQFYDNRVLFDPYRNRFWIGALAINANTKNEKTASNPGGLVLTPAQRGSRRTKFLLAVSKTEDPRDGWHRYWWDATKDDGSYNYGEQGTGVVFVPGDAGDYPYIGIDPIFLTQTNIVGNRDPTTGATTKRRYAFVNMVNADDLANGGLPQKLEIGKTVFGSTYAPVYDPDGKEFRSAIQPALHLTNAGGLVYLVGVLNDPDKSPHVTRVVLWHRSWLDGKLKARVVPVQPSHDWTPAPQGADANVPKPLPLTFRNLNAFTATFVNGLLHFAFGDSIQSPTGLVESMRVIRIPATEPTPAGLIDPAKGFIDRALPATAAQSHYGWPALTATAKGDMVLAYQRTSASSFPEVRYNVWPNGAGGPQPSGSLRLGQMPFVGKPDAHGSVGDFDMVNIAPDPDGKSVWIAHPFPFKPANPKNAFNNYMLAVGRVVP